MGVPADYVSVLVDAHKREQTIASFNSIPRWEGKISCAKEIMTNEFLPQQELIIRPMGMLWKTSVKGSEGNKLQELLLKCLQVFEKATTFRMCVT